MPPMTYGSTCSRWAFSVRTLARATALARRWFSTRAQNFSTRARNTAVVEKTRAAKEMPTAAT